MSLLKRIYKGRHDCLRDNEEPRDLLVSCALNHALMSEFEPRHYMIDSQSEFLMGMHIEWVKPGQNDLSIRTTKGDIRIVAPLIPAAPD